MGLWPTAPEFRIVGGVSSFPGPERPVSHTNSAAKAGIGFGSALAITISWSANHSILWAILHGLFGWFYVVYYAIRY